MSSYSNTFNGKGRDAARAKFTGKDLDDQFDAIASDLGSVSTDLSGKADKVTGATSGNIATLDASGNLVDSGKTFTTITPFLHIQDQKPSGTTGGASVAGVNTRDLNTVLTNEISGASLASNQITLPAGTYYVEASAPTYLTDQHQLRMYNATISSYILDGTSEYGVSASNGAQTRSWCCGRFVLATSSVLELHHLIRTVGANGLGVNASATGTIDHNTYADVKIWKIS